MVLRLVLEIVLICVVARAFWRLIDGIMAGLRGPAGPTRVPQRGVQMVRDPVCGTFVVPDNALAISAGPRRLHFCSTRCRDQYLARSSTRSGRTA